MVNDHTKIKGSFFKKAKSFSEHNRFLKLQAHATLRDLFDTSLNCTWLKHHVDAFYVTLELHTIMFVLAHKKSISILKKIQSASSKQSCHLKVKIIC